MPPWPRAAGPPWGWGRDEVRRRRLARTPADGGHAAAAPERASPRTRWQPAAAPACGAGTSIRSRRRRARPRQRPATDAADAAPAVGGRPGHAHRASRRRRAPNIRLRVIGLLVAALFALMFIRLWYLQVLDTSAYSQAVAAEPGPAGPGARAPRPHPRPGGDDASWGHGDPQHHVAAGGRRAAPGRGGRSWRPCSTSTTRTSTPISTTTSSACTSRCPSWSTPRCPTSCTSASTRRCSPGCRSRRGRS